MPVVAHQAVASHHAAAQTFSQPAFSGLRETGTPSLILRGREPCVVWANKAAAELFEVTDYASLQRRLIGSGGTPTRMMRDLMAARRIGAKPRLERLRWSWGNRVHNLTALCARGDETDGVPAVLMAFVGALAARPASTWAEETDGQPMMPFASAPEGAGVQSEIEAPVAAFVQDGDVVPVSMESRPAMESRPDEASASSREMLRAVLGGSDMGRFGWRTDAEGAIVQIDENLMRMLGLPFVHDGQTTLIEQVAAFDAAAAEQLGQAMAEGVTWSGVEILCPAGHGSVLLPVAMSASPQFDAARRFGGYRGFGRLNLATLRPRHAAAAPLPADSGAPSVTSAPAAEPMVRQDGETPVLAVAAADLGEHQLLMSPLPGEGELILNDPRSPSLPPFDGAANVVQLWPVHSTPPARPPVHSTTSIGDGDADCAPSADRSTDVVNGDQRSSIEAAVGRSLDRKGALTSSEHQAFQEIGRTLGPGPRRATSPFLTSQSDKGSPSPTTEPFRGAETDLTRHAAALVEHMTAGLLVVRNKRVLFANEALREALRFESHSELLDSLALHLARLPPTDEEESRATLSLPSAYGEPVGFSSASRVIVWNGQPAVLWTLAGLDLVSDASSERAKATPVPERSPGPADRADPVPALDVAGEAIAVIDAAGRIQELNTQGERFFGRRRTEVRGQDFSSLLATESRAAAIALLNQLKLDLSNKGQRRGECIGRSADGSSLPLEMRIAWLDAERLAVVWRDLSAQRAIERELAQLRRQVAKGAEQQPDFLANVSHQVRTPLNAILGFAEIMMDERFGPLGNPRYKDYLKDIHASGAQVIAVIDDLLDLSRIEAGRLDLTLGAIDINKVVSECVTEAHALAHRERIIVRTSLGPRLPLIMADEPSARQIIGNLLSNAIKFNEPGGQVIVSTASSDPSSVVVRIRDTGIGMSDSDIASALEPFRKLAPTKNASGTGLGLPLTKALATANGASLSMRSRPHEGTMVEVTFQGTLAAPKRVPA